VTPLTRSLSILAVAAWLVAAGAAFVYRDTLAASNLGALALIVLAFPFVVVLYMLAEALGEGVVFLLVLSAFKLVTLGLIRTEFTSYATSFPWYGLVRDQDGRLVASEGCVYIIGFAAYVAAGVGWYLWRS
jgi:hypothetical protein